MYVCMYMRTSLALNLEIGKTNWHSTVIANIKDSALSLVVSQMADPTQFWSAIFMFCSEKGRWQAAISSSVHTCIHMCNSWGPLTFATSQHRYTPRRTANAVDVGGLEKRDDEMRPLANCLRKHLLTDTVEYHGSLSTPHCRTTGKHSKFKS